MLKSIWTAQQWHQAAIKLPRSSVAGGPAVKIGYQNIIILFEHLFCFPFDSCLVTNGPEYTPCKTIQLKIHEINIVVYLAQISAHFIPDLTIDLG